MQCAVVAQAEEDAGRKQQLRFSLGAIYVVHRSRYGRHCVTGASAAAVSRTYIARPPIFIKLVITALISDFHLDRPREESGR
jgi:hypothetical protein